MQQLATAFRAARLAVAAILIGTTAILIGTTLSPTVKGQEELPQEAASADGQATRDQAVVEALLRIPGFDLSARPDLKASVLRYLERHEGTPRYVEVARRFELRETSDTLLELARETEDDNLRTDAVRLLLEFGQSETLRAALLNSDPAAASSLAAAVSSAGGGAARDLLTPLVVRADCPLGVRSAAARALGRSRAGQRQLLEWLRGGELADDLAFTVANVFHNSTFPEIREEALPLVQLPAVANDEPLPPLSELAQRRGRLVEGEAIFRGKGTCIKCHRVRGEGKEVGPDLSEIGKKLSREALYVTILDPSAGISHNYESYTLTTLDGEVFQGVLVSETDNTIILRDAEAIDRTFAREDVDVFVRQPVSLMPADLQRNLTVDDLVDLVEYLRSLK